MRFKLINKINMNKIVQINSKASEMNYKIINHNLCAIRLQRKIYFTIPGDV